MTPDPVIIIGCARSGTTLLQELVSTHPNYADMKENTLLPAVADKFSKTSPEFFYLETGLSQKAWSEAWATAVKRFYRMLTGDQALTPVDKVTYYTYQADIYRRLFPQCKIIYIYRHALDVALSMTEETTIQGREYTIPPLADSLHDALRHWKLVNEWALAVQTRLYPLPYEELVTSPGRTACFLMQWLGDEATEAQSQLPNKQSIYRHRQELTPDEANALMLDTQIDTTLSRLGYTPPPAAG